MPCTWEAPDGSRAVILDCAVVEQVRARVLDAYLSLPRRGAETGGLLLGHVDRADPNLVWVDGFEEIPCEHRYGPSYVLSDADRARLRQALTRPADSPVAVGLFRSYTGREPALDAADDDLIRTYLRDKRYAYLLVKPISSDECEAAFIFWENGELPAEPRYPRFALDPSRMAREPAVWKARAAAAQAPAAAEPEQAAEAEQAETPVAVEAEPEAEPDPRPEPEIAVPAFAMPKPWRRVEEDEETAPRKPRHGVWLPLLAIILASVGAALVYEIWKIGGQARWTELPLDAHAAAGRVELIWDRSAPVVTQASRGVLSVTDGPVRQDIRLNPAEIRAGSYAYKPAHGNLLFHLELYDGAFASGGGGLRLLTEPAAVAAPVEAKAEAPKAAPPPRSVAQAPKAARTGIAERETAAAIAVPPTVLHEVHPAIPAGIRSRIHGRIVVPVQVQVASDGKVTHAAAESGGNATYRYLARRAAAAAYSWRFQPARSRGGRAVAATKTIYFVFTRS
jgi:hypothetical protein